VPDRKRSQGAEPRHSNTNLSRFFTTGKQFSVGSVTVARSSQSKPVLFFMRRSKQASPFRTEVLVFFSSIGQPVGNSTTLTALIRGILDRSTEMKGCVRARKQERGSCPPCSVRSGSQEKAIVRSGIFQVTYIDTSPGLFN